MARALFSVLLLAFAALAACASAQAATAYIRSGGTGEACTRATPCSDLFHAINVAGANGTVICLDNGILNDGTGTSNSLVIDCPGSFQGFLTLSGSSTTNVTIRNMTFSGEAGLRITGGGHVVLENCAFVNNPYGALEIETTAAAKVTLINTTFTNSIAGAILVRPTGNAPVSIVLDRVRSSGGLYGLRADGGGQASGQIDVEMRDSAMAHHGNNGVLAVANGGQAAIHLKITRSTLANNTAYGAVATGPQAFMIVSDSSLTKNGTGLAQLNGATVATYANNDVNFNAANVAGTITTIARR